MLEKEERIEMVNLFVTMTIGYSSLTGYRLYLGAWGSCTSMITFLRSASDVKFSIACGHNL